MANWNNLKQAISDVIKTNGNQEITGAVLQSVLLNIISNFGDNITYCGIATPDTNPGTPDGPVFYFAFDPGTYTNFGGIVIGEEAGMLTWNNSEWSVRMLGFASASYVESQFAITPNITNGIDTDLDVADENGDVILRLVDGDLYTKNFNSTVVIPIQKCEGILTYGTEPAKSNVYYLAYTQHISETGRWLALDSLAIKQGSGVIYTKCDTGKLYLVDSKYYAYSGKEANIIEASYWAKLAAEYSATSVTLNLTDAYDFTKESIILNVASEELAGFMSAKDKQDLSRAVKPEDGTDADLDVADENGNVILRLANGEIEVKNFNSSKIKQLIQSGCKYYGILSTDEDALLNIPNDLGAFLLIIEPGIYLSLNKPDGLEVTEDQTPGIISRIVGNNWEFTALSENRNSITPKINDTENADLDVTDESGNVILRLAGGDLQTKNFDSSATPKQTDNNSVAEFSIADENGNVIAEFSGGNFRTKNFDSTDIETNNSVFATDDDSQADLNIGDAAGNVIAQFKNGHIKTKNFDSSNVATESYPVMYAHFSLDDIDTCISNLASNESTYTSIFDEPLFAKLKAWHDTYGMKVSLYCFNNLSSLPTKFAQNFIDNKDWLKLAYHGHGATWQSITYDAAQTLYKTFTGNITSKIGDIDVLDRVPRLDYFHCTKQGCLGMRDCDNGIVGFLGCDDWSYNKQTRATNYYLSDAQSVWLDNNNRLFDYGNMITFFKTDFRLEQVSKRWGTIDKCLAFYETSNQRKSFEFFSHETYLRTTSYDSMMETILTWIQSNNFTWDFPMNNLFLID